MGQAPAVPSGRKWQGAQSCQGATELVFPGPALGKMQSKAAGRTGEPSGHREEAAAEGFGGHHLLAQRESHVWADLRNEYYANHGGYQ